MYDVSNFKTTLVELCILYIYLFNFIKNNFIANLRNNSIGHGFTYNFKDPIHLYNYTPGTEYIGGI